MNTLINPITLGASLRMQGSTAIFLGWFKKKCKHWIYFILFFFFVHVHDRIPEKSIEQPRKSSTAKNKNATIFSFNSS